MCECIRDSATQRRRAHTLIELVIGSAVMAIVMLAIGSTLNLMTRGATGVEKQSRLTTDATVVMARLRREIASAVTIVSLSPAHIEFTHPDINGDGADDVIIYDWSGNGGSLTRRVNSGSPVDLLGSANEFALTPHAEQRTFVSDTSDETNEQLLASHDSCTPPYSCTFEGRLLSSSTWRGERFTPSYSGAQSFSVTRVKLYLQGVATSGNLYVSVRTGDAGTVYQEVAVPLSSLSSAGYFWYDFAFSSVSGIPIGQSISVVARTNTSGTGANFGRDQYTFLVPINGLVYIYTTNSGSYWMNDGGYDARFFVYGRFKLTQPQESPPITRSYLTHVDIRLKLVDGPSAAALDSGAMCVNRPEITGLGIQVAP
jgi:type II secretory pathway pseudopilin PulG